MRHLVALGSSSGCSIAAMHLVPRAHWRMLSTRGMASVSSAQHITQHTPPQESPGRIAQYPSLRNKRAVVTGGGRGIGGAIVEALACNGVHVLACGRSHPRNLLPAGVLWQTTDVSDPDSVKALAENALGSLGGVDILVNNAGVTVELPLDATSNADLKRVLPVDVNCIGISLSYKQFVPLLQASRGCMINIGSISAHHADVHQPLYNATKGFVHALTRSIALDHGPHIRANAIAPGWINTDMLEAAFELASNPEAAKADALRRHPAGRFGEPNDVAKLALFLASDQSSFITGATIVQDGGLTIASPIQPTLF